MQSPPGRGFPTRGDTRPPDRPVEPDEPVEVRPSWWNEPLTDDPRLDEPITDGRTVQKLGIMVALVGALALAAVVALFAYAILWAG
jgi:hypothetical protein